MQSQCIMQYVFCELPGAHRERASHIGYSHSQQCTYSLKKDESERLIHLLASTC